MKTPFLNHEQFQINKSSIFVFDFLTKTTEQKLFKNVRFESLFYAPKYLILSRRK